MMMNPILKKLLFTVQRRPAVCLSSLRWFTQCPRQSQGTYTSSAVIVRRPRDTQSIFQPAFPWTPFSPWSRYTSRRTFWRMLNAVFNRPDKDRIKEVGANRACAEWLLRCGAHVRWVGIPTWQTDYNSLPSGEFHKFKIEEVNADDAAVMDMGFAHFDGVKCLRKIRFNYCPYLEDTAIEELRRVKDSLEHLEIISCGDVSERGLASVAELSNLKTLYLHELPGVRDKTGSLQMLKKALPNCEITFTDVDHQKTTK